MIQPHHAVLALVLTFFVVTKTHSQSVVFDLDGIIEAQLMDRVPGASILIAKGDQVLFRKAFGYSDMDALTEMSVEHGFQIGSLTKQFTAVAIMTLVQQEVIRLEDDIRIYLPDYLPNGPKVTIKQLLGHISGVKNQSDINLSIIFKLTDY